MQRRFRAKDGGDAHVLFAATILQDCVSTEKSRRCVRKPRACPLKKAARCWANSTGRAGEDRGRGTRRGRTQFFSRYRAVTLEAKTLQDADRLDAIGMLGVARCFYVAGRMGSALYDPLDPHASERPLDDRRYALDHFRAKLLKLASGFGQHRCPAGALCARALAALSG